MPVAKRDRLCARTKQSGRRLKIARTLGHGVEIIWDDLVRDTPRGMGVSPSCETTHVTTHTGHHRAGRAITNETREAIDRDQKRERRKSAIFPSAQSQLVEINEFPRAAQQTEVGALIFPPIQLRNSTVIS